MSEENKIRLSKVKGDLNVSLDRIFEFLEDQGFKVDRNPNQKISEEMFKLLRKEFAQDMEEKEESKALGITTRTKKETITIDEKKVSDIKKARDDDHDEIIIKDMNSSSVKAEKTAPAVTPVAEEPKTAKPEVQKEPETVKTEPVAEVVTPEEVVKPKVKSGITLKVISKIDIEDTKKPAKKGKAETTAKTTEKTPEKKGKTTAETTKTEAPEVEKTEAKVEVKTTTPEVVNVPEVKKEEVKEEPKKVEEAEIYKRPVEKLEGPKIMGKIELPVKDDKKKPVASSSAKFEAEKKKKRKRIRKDGQPGQSGSTLIANQGPRKQLNQGTGGGSGNKNNNRRPNPNAPKAELTEEEVQKQIKETLARLSGQGKSKSAKFRREKRDQVREKMQEEAAQMEADKSTLKVTEFVTASQLASMMTKPVTEIISTCMQLGLFVSINQRLDAETIKIVAEEFGYQVEWVSAEVQEAIKEEEDRPEDLVFRSPIVTVMGHVDHGKTSLLDYVRKANVIAGEAGGITQHIGAYNVTLENGKHITFLDTPGHEAFTAMRARGAQITDVAIIVIAADDSVMPQTDEAINHAQAAGVPMIFAINKIDKPGANPENIRQALSQRNILVEEWGGKYQCQEISAKKGQGIDLLLEKVLLEAELLDLKANPKRRASGVVIESKLDKGRGYTVTMLVENGTLNIGDVVLAGCFSGRVKAMHNERGMDVKSAGPAMPVEILGLSGAPQAGDQFNVMADEREAREIANKRLQLQREQQIRTTKHITIEEIGRRIALGDFKELNIIVKGDVDGSIEALSDSLLKLSTEKIQVRIVHKGVGAITESDVLLASASNAIIVGFQVRPTANSKKLAEHEQIEIRLYSVIYKAIEEVKAAMEGMLAPEFEEKIVCNVEIREVFRITKVGTVAGCYVLDGKITRNTKVRIIRAGIVLHDGELGSLKRFKDDVKEVAAGYECGLNINGFDNIEVGDIIEGYDMVEIKRKL